MFSNTIHVLACGKAPSEYNILSEIVKGGELALLKAVHIFLEPILEKRQSSSVMVGANIITGHKKKGDHSECIPGLSIIGKSFDRVI